MSYFPFSQPRIFFVGYPRAYRLELAEAFKDQGYEVAFFADARLAAHTLSFECPDVVLMNWATTLPLTTLEFVERYSGVRPVLILSRHNILIDVVQSLKSGAADFIKSPCYFPEILARVERAQAASPTRRTLTIGKLTLDVGGNVAHIENVSLQLTKRETCILAALIRCPEQAVSRAALMRVANITDVKSTIVESYIK
ncbi:MAG: response regulator transcription factor [Magnetovibrio sp.]|nr:response regulator transcription factor [Magnetovibrio sp.]